MTTNEQKIEDALSIITPGELGDIKLAKPGRQLSDMETLMATGARLLKQKVDERIAAVSAYEKQRVELADSYRVRIARLKIAAEDELHKLSMEHADNIRALEDLIDKLKTLRGA
jgi:hypothetical protein